MHETLEVQGRKKKKEGKKKKNRKGKGKGILMVELPQMIQTSIGGHVTKRKGVCTMKYSEGEMRIYIYIRVQRERMKKIGRSA